MGDHCPLARGNLREFKQEIQVSKKSIESLPISTKVTEWFILKIQALCELAPIVEAHRMEGGNSPGTVLRAPAFHH